MGNLAIIIQVYFQFQHFEQNSDGMFSLPDYQRIPTPILTDRICKLTLIIFQISSCHSCVFEYQKALNSVIHQINQT